MSLPWVTAIMPTQASRRRLIGAAFKCFKSQTYPNLAICACSDEGTIGAKRNLLCAQARGEVIIHWDDDDWSAPERIETQVNHLLMAEQPVVGFNRVLFADDANRKAWLYNGAESYAIGSSLCYWKRAWQEHPFEDKSCGEDNSFIHACGGVNSMATNGLLVCRIHPGNTSTRVAGSAWIEQPWSEVVATGYEAVTP